jgi:hypothetical protein
MPTEHLRPEPASKRSHPTVWQPHDDPAEGSREIEESNRQASQSQPNRFSRVSRSVGSNEVEPSDSGPEYFGKQ